MRRRAVALALLVGCGAPPEAPSSDADGDGITGPADCDPARFVVHAGAPEWNDGLDNDCDGAVDEGPAPDADGASYDGLEPAAAADLALSVAAHRGTSAGWQVAVQRAGTRREAHEGLAKALIAEGKPTEAEAALQRALTLAKAANDVLGEQEARRLLGSLKLAGADPEAARQVFAEGILRSDDGSTWGCAYQGLGELYTALGTLDAEAPDATPAQAFDRGVAALRQGRTEAARRWAERAAADPQPPHLALLGFGKLLARDYAGAAAAFDAAGDDPGVAVGRLHLAIAQRRYDEARRLVQQPAAGWDGLLPELRHLAAGWLGANTGAHADALAAFDALLATAPDSLLGLLGKANSLMSLERFDEADALYRRVLELDPGNPYARAERGVLALQRGQLGDAEAMLTSVAEDVADYTCPHEGLGLVFLAQGRTAEAQQAFEKAIALNPDIEFKKYNGLARIHLAAGRLDEAEQLLRKSLANVPHDNPATELLAQLEAQR